MRVLTLKRFASDNYWTIGVILNEKNIPVCFTVERPWKNNEKEVSCIPPGEYQSKKRHSEHFGDTYETIVPGRTDILYHKGNFPTDSKGCIVLCESFFTLAGLPAGSASGNAFSKFKAQLDGVDEFKLVVANV